MIAVQEIPVFVSRNNTFYQNMQTLLILDE